jgi:hypothetical protein
VFYDWIVLLLKEQFYEIMFTFTACFGGPWYGIAAPQETSKIKFYIESPPVWIIVAFKRAVLKFLKLLANLSLDQN